MQEEFINSRLRIKILDISVLLMLYAGVVYTRDTSASGVYPASIIAPSTCSASSAPCG
jgi:hypothetical protein